MQDSSQLKLLDLSRAKFPLTHAVLEAGIKQGVAPGFVGGLWTRKDPDQFYLTAIGQRRLGPHSLPMLPETVFDIASLSKIFATATLCGVLVDRGWLRWDTFLSSILSEYPYPQIQIQHLLSHTAGLPAWKPLWESLWKAFAPIPIDQVPILDRQREMRRLVVSVAPEVEPGQRVLYSDITFLLLGFALEVITQMSLDKAVEHFVWKPMGVSRAYYRPIHNSRSQKWEEVAATEDDPARGGVLQGQVHDDNCWAMGGYGGHAGVFTDARNLFQFVRALMGGFLSLPTLSALWTPVLLPMGASRTLGWDMPSGDLPSAGKLFSRRSVGHLGFTGTSLWVDLDAELAVVLLSNRVHPTRENLKIREFRPQFHEAIRTDVDAL